MHNAQPCFLLSGCSPRSRGRRDASREGWPLQTSAPPKFVDPSHRKWLIERIVLWIAGTERERQTGNFHTLSKSFRNLS